MVPTEFKLEQFFEKYEFSAPYLLAQSDCEAMRICDLLQMLPDSRDSFLETWLGYSENNGAYALRRQIASLYQFAAPEDVLVHAGAQEVIYSYMHVLLEKGNHIVCMFPAYESLYTVAQSIGCEIDFWHIRQGDGGWEISMDELERLVRPDTKLIVLNTPNNPTGCLLSVEQMRRVCEIAGRYGVRVFADEVYKGLERDGVRRPWFSDLYERALSLGVMSKAYGLPGLRIGWAVTRDQEIRRRLSQFKNYLSICCAAPSEALAIAALRVGEQLLERSRRIIEENLRVSDEFFARYPKLFLYNRPAGGPIAFHRINIERPIDAFCEEMARKAGVLLLPGSVYNFEGTYFRMGYGRKNFPDNLKQLENYLEENCAPAV